MYKNSQEIVTKSFLIISNFKMKFVSLTFIFLQLHFALIFSHNIHIGSAFQNPESHDNFEFSSENFNQSLETNGAENSTNGELHQSELSLSVFPASTLHREKRDSNKTKTSECKCGVKQNKKEKRTTNEQDVHRIVGGRPAEIHEFPWRCALFYQDERRNTFIFFCGCSIIHENWAMTAAHCTDALKKAGRTKLFVDVGDHDLGNLTETKNRVIPVTKIYQHEKYNRRTLNNDISLLKLANPVRSSDNAAPVCLPFPMKNRSFDRSSTTVSGWGIRKEGKREKPSVLNKVDLSVISQAQCRRYIRSGITENMLCTLSPGKDACQGDSGGSLDFEDSKSGQFHAVGIVSFGHGCGRRSPGVFTRVTKYLSFIKEKTGEKFCGE